MAVFKNSNGFQDLFRQNLQIDKHRNFSGEQTFTALKLLTNLN